MISAFSAIDVLTMSEKLLSATHDVDPDHAARFCARLADLFFETHYAVRQIVFREFRVQQPHSGARDLRRLLRWLRPRPVPKGKCLPHTALDDRQFDGKISDFKVSFIQV